MLLIHDHFLILHPNKQPEYLFKITMKYHLYKSYYFLNATLYHIILNKN